MRRLASSLILCLLVTLLLLAGCGDKASQLERHEAAVAERVVRVPVTRVTEEDFERSITGTGSLRAEKRTRIQPHVSGQLVALPVEIGDVVEAGQVLARVRAEEYEDEVARASAALEVAQARLADLLAWRRSEEVEALAAALEEARAAEERAVRDFQRKAELLEAGGLSRTDFDRAQEEQRRAQAARQAAQARLAEATAGPTRQEIAIRSAEIKAAEAALAETRRRLTDTEIRAPYNAAITGKFAEVGQQVNAQMQTDILEISDLSTLHAYFLIGEYLIPYLRVGMPGTIEITSTGQVVPATVLAVNPAAEELVRSFLVKAEVANPDGALQAGLFVRGTLALDRQENVPAVPRPALRYLISDGEGAGVENHNRAMLFALDDENRIRPTVVRTGLVNGSGYVQILEGIEPGRRVVADGTLPLLEGQEVQPEAEEVPAELETPGEAPPAPPVLPATKNLEVRKG